MTHCGTGFGTNGTKGWLGNYGAWDQTEALKWSVFVQQKEQHLVLQKYLF